MKTAEILVLSSPHGEHRARMGDAGDLAGPWPVREDGAAAEVLGHYLGTHPEQVAELEPAVP